MHHLYTVQTSFYCHKKIMQKMTLHHFFCKKSILFLWNATHKSLGLIHKKTLFRERSRGRDDICGFSKFSNKMPKQIPTPKQK